MKLTPGQDSFSKNEVKKESNLHPGHIKLKGIWHKRQFYNYGGGFFGGETLNKEGGDNATS